MIMELLENMFHIINALTEDNNVLKAIVTHI